MIAHTLLDTIERAGGRVEVIEGDMLRIEVKRGALSADIKEQLAQYKQDILILLKGKYEAHKPYIDKHGVLVIPFESVAKYQWWAGGQSVVETLKELNAPIEVFANYVTEQGEA